MRRAPFYSGLVSSGHDVVAMVRDVQASSGLYRKAKRERNIVECLNWARDGLTATALQ
jgi:hypothetical protein